MGGRGNPNRILCVNCNICVNIIRRYPALQLDTKVISVLCTWADEQIITEDDYVCEACRDLAMSQVNNDLQEDFSSSEHQSGPSQQRGHRSVCTLCGCSILRRQSDIILRENPSHLHQCIFNIIQSQIEPRQISASNRVCHPCWLRAKREAERISLVDSIRSPMSGMGNEHESREEEEQELTSIEPVSNSAANIQKVDLPEYRRAANTSNHCVFPGCNATTLMNITDKLRATVLQNHKYYLPRLARICAAHLISNSWETLFDLDTSIKTFTVQHIQHVFSMVNTFTPR